ncbi:uncharacterized protein PV06_04823 [Exophiala oligosperma]|uniref:Uncharacterized protein n=1 Tax=Exophiala oligosperma TaxID=215243 RepID=A0A0D2C1Y4_9EURO|nr:uncharacterized protein PV06_04823 [Exophiala oligosperma]KIW43752.1 hypothetical protein PV06_04823 [Exophiala oligosperma]
MPSRNQVANGLPTSRTPSPPDSVSSTSSSSSSTYFSASSGHSPPASPSVPKSTHTLYSLQASRPRWTSRSQTVLGAIDENGGIVYPDTPSSVAKETSPIARLHAYTSAPNRKKATIASTSSPPPNEFDVVLGPNGEKFADLRMNRKLDVEKSRGMLKRLMCFR